MGRNLGWLAMLAFAVSWFLPVHQMQEMASAMSGVASGLGEVMSNLGDSMAKELGGTVTKPKSSGPDLSGAPGQYGGPSGWQAFRFALDLLIDKEKNQSPEKDSLKTNLLGATALTNAVMLLALLMLLLNTRGLSRFVGLLLLACAGLNLGWIYHNEGDFVEGLRLGYYVWTGSFVLAGLSALMPKGV